MIAGAASKLIGRLVVALIVIFVCAWPFYFGFLVVGNPRWEGGAPTDEVQGVAGYAYVAFWVITQGAIVYLIDRGIRK